MSKMFWNLYLGNHNDFIDRKLRETLISIHNCSSLHSILDYKEPDFEEVFCLTFEITRDVFGEQKSFEFFPDGSKVPVTLKNKYVRASCLRDGENKRKRKKKVKHFRPQATIRRLLRGLRTEQICGDTFPNVQQRLSQSMRRKGVGVVPQS